MRKLLLLGLLVLAAACGEDGIDSNEAARRMYRGLDASIEKSLNLGFDGFNSASSANIDPQMTTGATTGTLVINGQVDQGASANKGMRLNVGMVDYSDGPFLVEVEGEAPIQVTLTYDTVADLATQPYLMLALRDIPDGTFTGSLTGVYQVAGDDIDADVTLALTMSGQIMDGGNGLVVRVAGSTTITGTATSGDGLYDVMVTR